MYSTQLKSLSFLLNGQVHSEEKINEAIEKIIKIKNITSKEFKIRLRQILLKSNQIAKYKNELKTLYGTKINKDNKIHMKMLFDIWSHFFPNDKDIQNIDKKWRKFNN